MEIASLVLYLLLHSFVGPNLITDAAAAAAAAVVD
jgi:hypothetical protein